MAAPLTLSSGIATIKNGAFITTVSNFSNPTINGRFSFSGWEYDRFQILFRSDGTRIDSQIPNNGIGVQITPSSNPDFGSSKTVQFFDFNTFTALAIAAPQINLNTFYDFKIIDDGNNIKVYITDMSSPLFTYSTFKTYGNKVQFGNREQAAGSWPPPYYLNIDSLSIIPEPSALSLLAVGLGVVLRRRRRTV
ncbi:MAG: PEP-CTERM sorting domain-containing protein [Proteobacteria bacterium]|nr:PEP-CTERM sorting domain-containing protein [Pseudomonadota bacterium]